ncbi:MAG: hypothetical protein VX130_03670 [Verrucomicrobiota bacterium]|nr:hypothetical protein [Verrucomicrobiota bacterium]
MKIVAIVLNLLILSASGYGILLSMDKMSRFDQNKAIIEKNEANVTEVSAAHLKFTEEHKARFAVERTRNQQLEEENFNQSREENKEKAIVEQTKQEIAILENDLTELNLSLEETKTKLLENQKALETSRNDLLTLTQSIPLLEGNIADMQGKIQEQKEMDLSLDRQLASYGETTEMYERHFDRTTDALSEDLKNKAWFGKGKSLRVRNAFFDYENGLLALPLGKDHGLEEERLLSVQDGDLEICKIKIMHAKLKHSVAHVIPLVGKPLKLLQLSEFDLYHL